MRGDAPAIPREQAAELLGTDPEDLQRVADFAVSFGLTVTESSPQKGSVAVSGTVPQMEAAFGVKLLSCEMDGKVFITYEGVLTIPAALDQIVAAVLGLDQRPVARH
jgi:kumamolisin